MNNPIKMSYKPYKSKECKFYAQGHCKFGTDCRFIHRDESIKPLDAEENIDYKGQYDMLYAILKSQIEQNENMSQMNDVLIKKMKDFQDEYEKQKKIIHNFQFREQNILNRWHLTQLELSKYNGYDYTDPFRCLPLELVHEIGSYLDKTDKIIMFRTSKAFNRTAIIMNNYFDDSLVFIGTSRRL